MKARAIIPYNVTLPLPAFVLHPLTALGLAVLHIYLAVGHLTQLSLGSLHWIDIWKGFGALAAAYVFAALASRGLARMQDQLLEPIEIQLRKRKFLPESRRVTNRCPTQFGPFI